MEHGGKIEACLVVRRVNNRDFTTCFLIFYLLIPFWNILLKSISKKQHQYLLSILGFLYVFCETCHHLEWRLIMFHVLDFCI